MNSGDYSEYMNKASKACFQANLENDKYKCPACGGVEAGTLRFITHLAVNGKPCTYSNVDYCQRPGRGDRANVQRKSRKSRKSRKYRKSSRKNSRR